ncbi:hypothetical protein QEJ31_15145 [Pigmentibacter sp. JX0631]|uniref:hypothetical protein n=1 Tax=Pigmentibacter sp. JX0631 TaxID=2976982 RepID=UPI0024683864|nr:hypothetical protein [Pigmentibacter sp. JX0631]WGL59866.1 hypothetical protein QEJ31_15145 [Pigmentibacter sp. JX0631]
MSETSEILQHTPTHLPPDQNLNCKESDESFTISAEEAADILGVNRSRLSQLTSKGIFSFEKRKIDTRNRLFYKLSDLLNHQRNQFQNSHNYLPKNQQENIPIIEQTNNSFVETKITLSDKPKINSIVQTKNNKLKTAKELFEIEQSSNKKNELYNLIYKKYEDLLIVKEKITQAKHIETKEKIYFQNKLDQIENKVQNILKKLSILEENFSKKKEEEKSKKIVPSKKSKNWKTRKTKFLPTLTTSR